MNKILKAKLIKIQGELEKERSELKNIFFSSGKSKADIMRRGKKQIIEEYQKEKATLKKYKMESNSEMIEYIVKLDLALRDLYFILRFEQ